MTWTPDEIPDLTGRTAVVTGGNGGLGLETVRELARRGARVIMAARNQDKAQAALRDIEEEVGEVSVDIRELDLASLASVERFADSIAGETEAVDILVNNAGLMGTPPATTEDGFEMQFGVNHLGHHALTARLLPLLLESPSARVVTVTSFARLSAPELTEARMRLADDYGPWTFYGLSKRANYHFALGLHRRFSEAGSAAESPAAHPGFSHTDLQARTVRSGTEDASAKFWRSAVKRVGMDSDRGAHSQLRAATDPDAAGGQLYGPLFGISGPAVRKPILDRPDREAIDRLFALSKDATGLGLDAADIVAARR